MLKKDYSFSIYEYVKDRTKQFPFHCDNNKKRCPLLCKADTSRCIDCSKLAAIKEMIDEHEEFDPKRLCEERCCMKESLGQCIYPHREDLKAGDIVFCNEYLSLYMVFNPTMLMHLKISNTSSFAKHFNILHDLSSTGPSGYYCSPSPDFKICSFKQLQQYHLQKYNLLFGFKQYKYMRSIGNKKKMFMLDWLLSEQLPIEMLSFITKHCHCKLPKCPRIDFLEQETLLRMYEEVGNELFSKYLANFKTEITFNDVDLDSYSTVEFFKHADKTHHLTKLNIWSCRQQSRVSAKLLTDLHFGFNNQDNASKYILQGVKMGFLVNSIKLLVEFLVKRKKSVQRAYLIMKQDEILQEQYLCGNEKPYWKSVPIEHLFKPGIYFVNNHNLIVVTSQQARLVVGIFAEPGENISLVRLPRRAGTGKFRFSKRKQNLNEKKVLWPIAFKKLPRSLATHVPCLPKIVKFYS